MKVRLCALGTTALLVVLSACTNQAPPDTGASPSATASPSSSPTSSTERLPEEIWNSALATTREVGGVTMDAQIVTDVEGFQRITSGQGYVHIPTASGDMTWTDERSVIREVRTPDGHFVGFDDQWYEESSDLPTTIAMDPLAGLDTATDITVGPDENVLGVPTRTLTGSLEPDARLMGVSDEELTVMDPSSGSMSATIWIDEDDQIVRIVREYRTMSVDSDPIEATVLFLFTELGQDRPIDVPETADAVPAPV